MADAAAVPPPPGPPAAPQPPPPPSPTPSALWQAFKELKWSDMERLGRMPCANSALLYGIGTGSVVGLGTYLLRRSVMKSCNYAVAAFAAVGILSFEKCQADRKRVQEEQAKLALAVSLTKKYHEQQRQKSSAGATGPLDPRVDVQPGPPPAAGDDGGAAAPPAPPLGPKVAN